MTKLKTMHCNGEPAASARSMNDAAFAINFQAGSFAIMCIDMCAVQRECVAAEPSRCMQLYRALRSVQVRFASYLVPVHYPTSSADCAVGRLAAAV